MTQTHPNVNSVQRAHTEHEYRVLSNSDEMDDVRYGERYWARVDGVETYGIFVSLNRHDQYGDRVDGLIHRRSLPSLRTPNDFAENDEVGVMLKERKGNGDLEFEMVATLDTLREFTIEQEPVKAPTGTVAVQLNGDVEPARASEALIANGAAAEVGDDPDADETADEEADEPTEDASEESDDEYVCAECDRDFDTPKGLMVHRQKTHGAPLVKEQAAEAVGDGARTTEEVAEALDRSVEAAQMALKDAYGDGLVERRKNPDREGNDSRSFLYSLPDEDAADEAPPAHEVNVKASVDTDEAEEAIAALSERIETLSGDTETLIERLEAAAAASEDVGGGHSGDTAPTREEAITTLTADLSPQWALFIRSALDVAQANERVTGTAVNVDADGAELRLEAEPAREER